MKSKVLPWFLMVIIEIKLASAVSNATSTLPNAWIDCQRQGKQLFRPDKDDVIGNNTTVWTGKVAVLSPWIAAHGCYSSNNSYLHDDDYSLCSTTSLGINDCLKCCNDTGYFALQKHNCYCVKDYIAFMRGKLEERLCWYATKNDFDLERKGGINAFNLYQKVYDSNETIHFYRRCVAAQCRYFGGAKFDPTDCTSDITGLCSNGDITDSNTFGESNSQCFLENVLLESLVSNIQSYCSKTNHQTKIWVGYNRYVDIYHYDGSITAVYMCEVAENINGTSVYKWTSKCRSSSYELRYLCTRDNEPTSAPRTEVAHSKTAVIAGAVSGVMLIAVFFIVVFAVYCRGYNEREVPKLTRESCSGHSTRVYVKATDDLRPLPPVENDRHFTCDTSVKNEASCSSTLDSNNEDIYEAYDSDVTDSKADVSTSEETHYAVSNQCYAMVGGEDNRAFVEEDQDLHQSYDFVEPSASLRLPHRIKERDDELDENVISKSSTFPVFQFSKDKTIEKYEIAENEYDHVETGKSIRLPPRIFEKYSSEDSPNVFERKSYIESSTNEITEESVDEDDIYDTQLASTIFKRQESLVADEEKDQAIASDLYKDMSDLSQRRRGSYVQMDIDDTYKVIDAHFSMKRK